MPQVETPNFEQIARHILADGGLHQDFMLQTSIADELRLIWNARGDADVEILECDSSAPASALTGALRRLRVFTAADNGRQFHWCNRTDQPRWPAWPDGPVGRLEFPIRDPEGLPDPYQPKFGSSAPLSACALLWFDVDNNPTQPREDWILARAEDVESVSGDVEAMK